MINHRHSLARHPHYRARAIHAAVPFACYPPPPRMTCLAFRTRSPPRKSHPPHCRKSWEARPLSQNPSPVSSHCHFAISVILPNVAHLLPQIASSRRKSQPPQSPRWHHGSPPYRLGCRFGRHCNRPGVPSFPRAAIAITILSSLGIATLLCPRWSCHPSASPSSLPPALPLCHAPEGKAMPLPSSLPPASPLHHSHSGPALHCHCKGLSQSGRKLS